MVDRWRTPRQNRRRFMSACSMALIFTLVGGCSRVPVAPREPFKFSHQWQVMEEDVAIAVSAKLQPEPLKADRPGMLEARVITKDQSKPFGGRLWYRFAYRRGDPPTSVEEAVVRPSFVQEEGVPARYDDWFEWAEIPEPRLEGGETVFSTPVMLSAGKAYIQFRMALRPEAKPHELLDWFIYVDPAE